MENFNADEARKIVSDLSNIPLYNLLDEIKIKAEEGGQSLHVYDYHSHETISELEKRGFEVQNHPSIAIQRDNLYYTIHW